jgi:3D-(3,5/4)-trihydroxycyclohexane-1,2-dione acylhydrolase (decyclizing)
MRTIRLTVGQATVRFLVAQYSQRDGIQQRLIAGVLGIFGHGNVAGFGQGLLESDLADPASLPYVLARNEQAMVHTASAYARMQNRLSTWACTASIGPGSTNMVTGAATATVNRLPVLLLPGDTFATRASDPALQQLEDFSSPDVTVNDALRPVSRFFARVNRPEQLAAALFGAMRMLTDPVLTGAVTVALPQDVQAEAHDWQPELFERRVWLVQRTPPDPETIACAAEAIRSARRPLLVSGGGTIYSDATGALRALCDQTGIPVGETQAGKGSLPYDHPCALGAIGSTGTAAANRIAEDADLVIGVGTRWTDFTTASRTAFQNESVRFVNVNVAPFDATKHAGVSVVADARAALEALAERLAGWSVPRAYRGRCQQLAAEWNDVVEHAYHLGHSPRPAQSEVIGAVNEVAAPEDVVVCAAGSMPGDLHKLWRTRNPKGYHVEYGYSCMGYEIAGGLGVRLACPDRDVFVLVGDGSYLMMAQELVTAVQERVKMIVVLVQNHGFASIGALSEHLGSQRFGTQYRYRGSVSRRLDGPVLPVDLGANAESLGARLMRVETIAELRDALAHAKASDEPRPIVVHIETDPLVPGPSSGAWWDVPVAEVANIESTREARREYVDEKQRQKRYHREGLA